MATRKRKHCGLAHYVPAVGWLPRYERRWLRGDLTAGVAVTALVVPKNLVYAGIAGDRIRALTEDGPSSRNIDRAIEAQLGDGETSGLPPGGDAAGAVS